MTNDDGVNQTFPSTGLTQAQVAARMGTQAPAVARLENTFVTGKPLPSLNTLKRYAHALGKQLGVRFI